MQSPQSYPGRAVVPNIEIRASAAVTDTNDGTDQTAVTIEGFSVLQFVCDLTAAATDVGDTFDLYVQTTLDGTNWVDIVHFTQMLGNGGPLRYFAKICLSAAEADFEDGDALAASAVRNLFGTQYRARWDITDAGTDNASFTFSLVACGIG